MGLFRDLTVAVGRAALDVIQKAGDPPPRRPQQDEDEETPRKAPGVPQDASGGEDGASGQGDEQDASADQPEGAAGQPDPENDPDGGAPGPGEQASPLPGALTAGPGKLQEQNQAPGGLTDGQNVQNPPKKVPTTPAEVEEAQRDPKSLFWDPFAVIDALGYKDKPSSITYQTLKMMVWRMPILQTIIQTRLKQVSNFSLPQVDRFSTGFRVSLRDRKAKPTPASEARSQQLERWLLSTGVTTNPTGRDTFDTFLQKYVRDSLIYDQATFEIVPSRSGKPAAFHTVDAATIRIADTTKLYVDGEDRKVSRYVQIYDGLVINEYNSSELSFGIRNPTADIRNQQYGQSELEMLVSTVTSLLWAWDYNQKFFSQGSNVKGIINFKGPIPNKQLNAFRQHWYGMTVGVENAFKTPIVNADDMQWVSMQQSNRDMEFNAWMDFLIKIASAMYAIDSMEIGFKYGDSGGGKSMFESANASKLTASKDKGLKPLLRFVQHQINQALIQPLDEDFQFEFVGLEVQSPSEQADLTTKLIKSVKTVDEARAEEDMPPLPNGLGAIILDPVYMQHLQMVQQAANPQPQGPPGEGGPPGDGGEDGGDQGEDQPPWGQDEGDQDEDGGWPPEAEKSLTAEQANLLKAVRSPSVPPRRLRKGIIVDVEV